jgi:hypothetical protein
MAYKAKERVLVKFGKDEYYLGTITSIRSKKIYVAFDDGDSEVYPLGSTKIKGRGRKAKYKKEIKEREIAKFLKESKKPKKPKVRKRDLDINLDIGPIEDRFQELKKNYRDLERKNKSLNDRLKKDENLNFFKQRTKEIEKEKRLAINDAKEKKDLEIDDLEKDYKEQIFELKERLKEIEPLEQGTVKKTRAKIKKEVDAAYMIRLTKVKNRLAQDTRKEIEKKEAELKKIMANREYRLNEQIEKLKENLKEANRKEDEIKNVSKLEEGLLSKIKRINLLEAELARTKKDLNKANIELEKK